MPKPTMQRFLEKVEIRDSGHGTPCWMWTGARAGPGYGHMYRGRRPDGRSWTDYVHRIAYEEFIGPIPDGLTIDHLCRVKLCCNPEHLEAVTLRENLMRSPAAPAALNAAKTHCPNEHPLAPFKAGGARRCSICRSTYDRRRRSGILVAHEGS